MKKTIFKKIFSYVLLLAFIITPFTSGKMTFAEEARGTTENQVATLKITKKLKMPKDGVRVPTKDFTFEFVKHSLDNKIQDKEQLPQINDQKVSFKRDEDDTKKSLQGSNQEVTKEIADDLKNVIFNKGGQFTYTLKLKYDTATEEFVTIDKSEWLVSIFVTKTADGFKPTSIQTKQIKDNKGQEKRDTQKVDNNITFTSSYDPKAGPNTPEGNQDQGTDIGENDKKGFALKKEMATAATDANEEFTFSLTVTKPVGSSSVDTNFDYYVVDKDGNVKGKDEGNQGKKTQNYDSSFNVNLHHNERIVFKNVLLGSNVKASETVAGAYTPSLKPDSSINGISVGDKFTLEILGNSGLVIGDADSGNFVTFLNNKQTATGFLLDNLPIVVLFSVAGLGVVFFLVSKKRRNAQA